MSRNDHSVLLIAPLHLVIWISLASTFLKPGISRAETPPDIQAVPKDRFLASKLGQTKLGELSRLKRDYAEAQHDLESAEIETAVAAVEAEHSKDEAIKALAHDVHLQEQISDSKYATSTSAVAQSSVSTGKQFGSSNTSSNQKINESEEYEDENEAEQTIIEDAGGNITATFISVESDDEFPKSKRPSQKQKANDSESGITGISCQKVIDLVTITNDFRKQLQQLLDREQQNIKELVQLYSSMKPTFQNLETMGRTDYGTNDAQPSRACVYISEHINAKQPTLKGFSGSKDDGPRDENDQGKLHIYTDKGIFPQNKAKALGNRNYNMPNLGPEPEAMPLLQGHFHPETGINERQLALGDRRTVRDDGGNVTPGHSGDIDLEQIYWIKPDDAPSLPTAKELPPVYNAVMKRIIGQGKDVLIIPISSTLKDVRAVSDSFLRAVKIRRGARATGTKLMMKILRVK